MKPSRIVALSALLIIVVMIFLYSAKWLPFANHVSKEESFTERALSAYSLALMAYSVPKRERLELSKIGDRIFSLSDQTAFIEWLEQGDFDSSASVIQVWSNRQKICDGWGRELVFYYAPTDFDNEDFSLRVLSFGKNGVYNGGEGDDILSSYEVGKSIFSGL